MLRIARVTKSTFIQSDSNEEIIFSKYSDLTKLVKQHLSPVTASIFAIPTVQEDSNEIEWSSELKGQPVQLNSLPKDEQQQAKKLLNDRLSAIDRLADKLPQQASETEKLRALLKQALHYPGDEAVYVINGQPVITFWGVDDKTKSTNAPILTSTIPMTNGAQKQRKKPRFFLFLGWLVLLALLAFLWYWLANNPVNWQAYNPFAVDEYQQLVNEAEEAGDDCFALDNIYQNNVLLQRPEEKFNLIKQQVEAKLVKCEAYKQLLKTIQLAEGNCQELRNILEKSSYLQTPEGLFIKWRDQLENDIQLCEYNNLKSKIQTSSDNCPELSKLLNNNQYLHNPQGKFVELRQQLESSVNLCTKFQKLKSKIDSAKDNCPLLTKINTENPPLQNFNCTKKELESLPKVFGAEFVEGFATFTPKTKKRALKEINMIGEFLSRHKNATVLITLHTVVSGPNDPNPSAIASGLRTTRNVLDARFQSVVNGIMKVSGTSRKQIKKNAYKYNRTNRIVTFTINNT